MVDKKASEQVIQPMFFKTLATFVIINFVSLFELHANFVAHFVCHERKNSAFRCKRPCDNM
jgi:hypothetical protein